MLKLFVGNKAYSSWSLRGWLAVKQSGLPFEEEVIPMYTPEWDAARESEQLRSSGGKVPILWDDGIPVWDSLAIIEWLAERTDRNRFWPEDDAARAMARSIAAEMHSSYPHLRRECSMNVRRRFPARPVAADVQGDVDRIVSLWSEARTRFGQTGDYLFGDFGAADIMFAPVVTRFVSYAIPVPDDASAYIRTIMDHPWMQEWIEAARQESWVIQHYEVQAS